MIKVDDIAKETLDILKYFDFNFVSKIPNNFLENLKKISKTSTITININKDKPLKEQEISEGCKDLISLLYYNYVANEREREEILEYWNENEEIAKQTTKKI